MTAESSAFRVDWLLTRFGSLNASSAAGITGVSGFGNMYTAALDSFQLRPFGQDNPCAKYWAASGRTEESSLLDAAAAKYGYKFASGPMHSVADDEFPWIRVTPDALTEDGEGGAEAKWAAARSGEVVPELDECPDYNYDQCMLQRRVCKRKWIDLVRGSHQNCSRARVQPDAKAEAEYWARVMPLYREFYDLFLAWYWEYDLTRAGLLVEQLRKRGDSAQAIGRFLLDAMTNGHERLARGGTRIKSG